MIRQALLAIAFAGSPSGAVPAQEYRIITFDKEFREFWAAADGKPIAQQMKLWDQLVERPRQEFYDSMVWSKKDIPDWPQRKSLRLGQLLKRYPAIKNKIADGFSIFPATIDAQIAKFKKTFPDSVFNVSIYGALSPTFNGREGSLDSQPTKNILAFGIDFIASSGGSPDVLYSHELFHIYHTQAIGLNEEVITRKGLLTLPLWLEGLAVYVSGQMNPKAGDSELLMDPGLAAIMPKDLRIFAKEFLKVANLPMPQSDGPSAQAYRAWFNRKTKADRAQPNLPERCGYRLGLEVVRLLAQSHSLQEMIHWDMEQAHKNVLEALTEIARRKDTGLAPRAPGNMGFGLPALK